MLMNVVKLTYGNCLIYSILFKIRNWNKSVIKFKTITNRGVYHPSWHIVYDNKYRITYRSRPKKNMSILFFKGRPQVVDLFRINPRK